MSSKREKLLTDLKAFQDKNSNARSLLFDELIKKLNDENTELNNLLFNTLITAIQNKNNDELKLLLREDNMSLLKPLREKQDGQGRTLLHFASINSDKDIILALIGNAVVDRSIEDTDKKTAYDLYKEKNNLESEDEISALLNPHKERKRIVEDLKKVCGNKDPYYINNIRYFELGYDEKNNKEIDRAILLAKILVHAISKEHDEVFNYFVNSEDVIQYFPQIFKKQKIADDNNLDPIVTAIRAKNKAYVEKLIGRGADFNLGTGGMTPLMHAISSGGNKNIEVIKFLLDLGADYLAQDSTGNTALHLAALGDVHALNALLKVGADIHTVNNKGKTPHDFARKEVWSMNQRKFGKSPQHITRENDLETILHILLEKEGIYDFSTMNEKEINECMTWDVGRVRDFEEKLGLKNIKVYREVSDENDRLIKTWLNNIYWVAKVDPINNLDISELINQLKKPNIKNFKKSSEKISNNQKVTNLLDDKNKKEEKIFPQSTEFTNSLEDAVFYIFNSGNYLHDKYPNITSSMFLSYLNGNTHEEENFSSKLIDKIRHEWTALPNRGMKDKEIFPHVANFILSLKEDGLQVNLDTKSLSDNEKIALQNIIAYAGKLMAESDQTNPALEAKIAASKEFVENVLTQKSLTTESIKQAFQIYEGKDKNRGTGFYYFHSFFKNAWFKDENGKNHLVKSTMGELVRHFYKTVEREEAEPKNLSPQ